LADFIEDVKVALKESPDCDCELFVAVRRRVCLLHDGHQLP
jgi:hypothetical protein